MNRITLCSPIASAIASRIGLESSLGAGAAAGSLLNIGIGSNWLADMAGSWFQWVWIFVGVCVLSARAWIAPPISAPKTS
jgi:hypothetical protein